jgi:group I intron endonuclease
MLQQGIYQITNLISGSFYIGQSSHLATRRAEHWRSLRRGNHHNQHIQYAWNRYGPESLKFTTLLYCELFELTHYEQAFVERLHPEYNICLECVTSTRGLSLSNEHKKKISISLLGNTRNLGRHHTDSTKQKMSMARKGKPHPYRRPPHSEETKQKMSIAALGRHLSEESKQKISKGHMGLRPTEETRKKMSRTHKLLKSRRRLEYGAES